MSRDNRAALAVLAWLSATPAFAQPAGEPRALGVLSSAPLMRWDPEVRYGRLPNGLRYALAHSDAPAGAVSLRLGIEVGSYDEAEDERGAAHLVTHMAFEASRSFTENQVSLTFTPLKVPFGPDRNASSDLSLTVYRLDLPSADAKGLAAAERWLRDAADGLTFAGPGLARARASMDAERAGRGGPLAQLRERVSQFEDGAVRSAARPILGEAQTLAALSPAKAKAFYDRWYRPERAAVVMVGDLPLDAMEQQVKATFGDWAGRGPAVAPPTPPASLDGGPAVLTLTMAGVTPVARICHVTATEPEGAPPQRLRTLLLREVWRAILQRRLNVVGTRADAPFSQTNISTDVRPDSLKTCVAIAPVKGGETRAIGLVNQAVVQFQAESPTLEEVDTALVQLRALIRGAIGATPKGPDRAAELTQRIMERMPQLAPREGLRAFDALLEDLTPAEVKAQFDRDWAGRGPLVAVVGTDPVPETDIRRAMQAVASAPASPPAARPAAASRPPSSPEQSALAKAEQLLRSGDLKGAHRAFDELVRRDPRDADALAGRGRAAAAQDRADPALKDFAAALAVQPDNGVALNARGNLYVALNRPEQAIPDFDAALAANPKDDVVLYNRGLAFKQMGRLDRAIRDFDAVLRITPRDALTLIGKADAYRELGDLLLAGEFYDAALAADPRSEIAQKGRDDVRAELGRAGG